MEEKKASDSADMVDVDMEKLLEMPDHFVPMQFRYRRTSIYVRHCYPIYYGILWNDLFIDQMDSVLITGTPGIGKSIFYVYVLEMMKLHLKDKVIVLASFSKQSLLTSCVKESQSQR
jgi:hypothetical protein